MKLASTLSFGQLIAHLCPGVTAFIAYTMSIDRLLNYSIFNFIREKGVNCLEYWLPIGIGTFVIALIFGLLVDGIRYAISDILFRINPEQEPKKLFLKYSSAELEIVRFLLDNFYRYYQFYSNMFVATLLFTIAIFFYSPPLAGWTIYKKTPILVFNLVLCIVLYFAAKKGIVRFYKHINDFLQDSRDRR